MSTETSDQSSRRIWRPDDMLTYEQACEEFTEWTPRMLRNLRRKREIDGTPGKGGLIHFRYSDLVALRESRRLRFNGQRPRGRR